MCGRGDISYDAEDVREALAALGDLEIHVDLASPRHNVSPTEPVPVVRREGEHVHVEGLRWGTRDPSGKSKAPLLLVRSESVAKGSLANRTRGLVLFSKFYEWQDQGKKKRVPWAARAADGRILALAALCQRSVTAEGEVVEGCTIITQPARGPLVEIHDRMPLLVAPGSFAAWLSPEAQTCEVLEMVRGTQEDAASLVVIPEDPVQVAREAREVRTF